MLKKLIVLVFSIVTGMALAQTPLQNSIAQPNSTVPGNHVINEAIAMMYPTKGSRVVGTITFVKVQEGVKVIADIIGLTPGPHGFHIHNYGDCSAPDAATAGDHFNPHGKLHGNPDEAIHHAGDLGNIVADNAGNAHYEATNTILALDGPNSIIGRSVIIHEKTDDLRSQPSGNSGARVACGVVGIANPKE